MMGEPSLFDFFEAPKASSAAAFSPSSIGTVHWVVVTTKRARTGCGIICSSYDLKTRIATTEAGEQIHGSLNRWSDRVTCQACKEAL